MKTSGVISLLFVCLVCLNGCGGGSSSSPASVASLSKVDAKISLAALSAALPAIAAIEATITFPIGVTVQTTPTDFHQAADSVVELTPQVANTLSSIRFARYSSATATTPGKLRFTVIDANGFNATQAIVLNFGITPGFIPLDTQFHIVNSQIRDINGALLSITPTLDIKLQ